MTKPIEIVVLSGKGGTGKTSVTAGFADLSTDAVFCDADVDAANLALVLSPEEMERHSFIASSQAFVDPSECVECGLCGQLCRFDAACPGIIDDLSCEGCGLCARACPSGAIEMRPVVSGEWFISSTEKGPLVHARLGPGEENSGRLVALVRQKAREVAINGSRRLIITDGPPGIGCPVIASLSNAAAALLVTEPSLTAIHDLKRALSLCERFGVPAYCVINKHDIHEDNSKRIEDMSGPRFRVIGRIPFDEEVPKSMALGLPVTRTGGRAAESIRAIWNEVLKTVDGLSTTD
ncbi:MAG: ATP-binding protein [Bacillota bacterium]|jgi:MinD superfamily P-loop ATPase